MLHEHSSENDGIFYRHPADNLADAMQGTCQIHPEETFCFLNEKALYDRARFLIENFGRGCEDNDFAVAYAVKANSRRQILKILDAAGISNFDCASINEIRSVQAVNPNAKILYNHPVRRNKDIQQAIAMGVTHFTIQSRQEALKVLTDHFPQHIDRKVEMVVRMETPNKDAAINLSTKFGASRAATERLLQLMDYVQNVTGGIAVNTGSQNTNPKTFRDAISQIAEVAKAHDNVHFINLGGGMPVNYFPADKFDINEYMSVINRAINELLGKGHKIIIEPGRSIVAEHVDLVIPITSVEKRKGRREMFIEDGVFTSFSDYKVHPGWQYNFQPYSPYGKVFSDEKVVFTVFGRTCDSGDVMHNVRLPVNIDTGDYLWVPSAGAYLDCQTTYFNGFEPPKYVSYNTLT